MHMSVYYIQDVLDISTVSCQCHVTGVIITTPGLVKIWDHRGMVKILHIKIKGPSIHGPPALHISYFKRNLQH